ncbi:hypothetical protein [Streptomyces sp. MNU89]|uniref:hypothetical protein n=1 Tax=Streptomyces sp. MNU89 TaxID=2560025 RepID=UPI001E4997E4|nr:hypothetical protein [Streptomyces sp. MNU89]MCC9741517.1 hypothetical protein [Streptomyces sp. MNU89]
MAWQDKIRKINRIFEVAGIRIEFRRILGGRTLQRKTFRFYAVTFWLAAVGTAIYVGIEGSKTSSGQALIASALMLLTGGLCVRIFRSRVHLKKSSLVIVNPLRWHDIPYGDIREIEHASSGSLIVHSWSNRKSGGEGYLSVGFAGSLIDGIFKTSAKAAAQIKAEVGKQRRMKDAQSSTGFVLDIWADSLTLCAILCSLAAPLFW